MNKDQILLEINAGIAAMLDSNWSYFSAPSALQLGNYRELDSDCLEFTKAAAKLASQQFVTARELAKSKVSLELKVKENLDDLTITSFKSEALSRRNPSSKYSALVSIVSMQSPLIQMFLVSLIVVTFYHFFIR